MMGQIGIGYRPGKRPLIVERMKDGRLHYHQTIPRRLRDLLRSLERAFLALAPASPSGYDGGAGQEREEDDKP